MRNLFYKRNLIAFTLFLQIVLFASDSFAINHFMKDNSYLVISYARSVRDNWEIVSDFELSKLKSQDTIDPKKKKNDEVMLLLRSYSDSIVIRFAPNDYSTFVNVIRKGIQLNRSEDNINFKTIATIFPVPKEKIDPKSMKSDSFAIMAASILNDEKINTNGMNLGQINQANNELFGMALMLAEFSASAAQILGLRFVDKNVEKGKTYFYTANITGNENIKTNAQIINEIIEQRAPYLFQVDTGDGFLKLKWSKEYNRRHFSNYWIERSVDNKTFYPILQKPLVMFETELSENFTTYEYIDSFNLFNDQIYYYKIYGGTAFAEYSKPALASGMPKDLNPPAPPTQFEVKYDKDLKEFQIDWNFDLDLLAEDFDHFQIMHSRTASGPFTPISSALDLSEAGYEYKFKGDWNEMNEGKHYFAMNVYDDHGNYSTSFTVLANVPDFTNPQTPENFSGYIDSMGIVRLKWNRSRSKDANGYWLYWSHTPDGEFSLVKQEMISDTNYIYYIPEKSLNKYIYYALRAEDFAYNRSASSDILKVKRLDKIAPIPPSILKVYNDSLNLVLDIKHSPSEDCIKHYIYRRQANSSDTSWQLLDSIKTETLYKDRVTEVGKTYYYKVLAVDDSGNKSELSALKQATLLFPKEELVVKNLKIKQNNKSGIELTWDFELPKKLKDKKYNYEIFKSSGSESVLFYKTLTKDELLFKDENLKQQSLYNYAVRIHFEDGISGSLSKTKSILVK